MQIRRTCIAALLCTGSACAAAAQIEVHRIDGTFVRGNFAGVDERNILLRRDQGVPSALALDEVSRIVFDADSAAPRDAQDKSLFYFARGGRCLGEIVAHADGGIQIRTRFADSLAVQFDQLAGIRFAAPAVDAKADESFTAELGNRLPG